MKTPTPATALAWPLIVTVVLHAACGLGGNERASGVGRGASAQAEQPDGLGAGGFSLRDSRADPPLWVETDEIKSPATADGARFGNAVSVDRDVALVGAPFEMGIGGGGTIAEAGAVHVLARQGVHWSALQRLAADDATEYARFGYAVSLSGSRALVGALSAAGGASGTGAAYVFSFDGSVWDLQAKLVASDGADGDWFGQSVATSGDVAIVGSPHRTFQMGGSDVQHAGTAYAYRWDGTQWNESILTAPDAQAGDQFGYSVSLSGDVALIGAPTDGDPSTPSSGAAYIYEWNQASWLFRQKLQRTDPDAGDIFGASVAIADDTAIVGAPGIDPDGMSAQTGAAYVFVRDGDNWQQQAMLRTDDKVPIPHEMLGHSVSLSGDTAAVGMSYSGIPKILGGSARVYVRDGVDWVHQAKLQGDSTLQGDAFGRAVSLSGEALLVGAPFAKRTADDVGAAYIFARVGASCASAADCVSGFCVDGVCCDSRCGNDEPYDCHACIADLTGPDEVDGHCAPVLNDTLCDDGLYCNGRETCTEGVCAHSSGDPCSSNIDDDDDDCAESCNENADACVGENPDGTPCGEAGSCRDGTCVHPPGSACDSDVDCASTHCTDHVCCEADSCGAYRCGNAGACHQSCTSAVDCALAHECSADGRCVPFEPIASNDGDCSCAVVGGATEGRGLSWWSLAAIAMLRRRRTKRPWPAGAHRPR